MNNNNTNTDLLIQYLDGELEGDALVEVKNKIANDPSLQQELEDLRSTQLAIKSYGLRQKVGSIHAEMMNEFKEAEPTKVPVRRMLMKAFRVAASIIVIIAMAAIYQYYSLSSSKLFEANYQPYTVHEMRGIENASPLENLYKQHLTQQMISKSRELKQPSTQDYFYLGNAYLQEHKPTRAIESFLLLQKKNAQTNVNQLEDDSEYYLAMSYLQNNEPCKALSILNKINNDHQHPYHDKLGSWFLFKVKLLCNK
jgi:hypothetical protein